MEREANTENYDLLEQKPVSEDLQATQDQSRKTGTVTDALLQDESRQGASLKTPAVPSLRGPPTLLCYPQKL